MRASLPWPIPHRRYGVGVSDLKLRQEGLLVSHKRVERLYTEERLQVRRRRRKKVPLAHWQPLIRPTQLEWRGQGIRF